MSKPTRSFAPPDLRADFVFEAAGIKGICLAGAYKEFADRGYTPQCVAGVSAGAMLAALVAAGYTPAEVEDVIANAPYQRFADESFVGRLGSAGSLAEFVTHWGLHTGDYLQEWLRARLAAKGITRFGELRDPSAADENRAYRLQVVVSDVTARRTLVLPRDAPQLGADADQLEIATAIRMSMSIPIFFRPVTQDGLDGEHVIADGHLLSGFPVGLFDAPIGTVPQFPTFGIRTGATAQSAPVLSSGRAPAEDASGLQFFATIAQIALASGDRQHIPSSDYARTVLVPPLGVNATDFAGSPSTARALLQSGTTAAARFLETWDFAAYTERFRVASPF